LGHPKGKEALKMNVEIANRLVQLRKQNNLSQEELAMRLGISRQAISKWERAESSPDTDNLIALAGLYKMSLDELVRSDLPPEPTAYTASYRPEPETEEEDTGETFAGPDLAEPSFSMETKKAAVTFGEGLGSVAVNVEKEAPEDEPRSSDPLPEGSFYDTPEGKKHTESWLYQIPYPLFITTLYLVLGFFFNQWHPGWLVFLTIPLHYMPEKEKRFPYLLGNPVMVALVYLVLGFYFNLWHPGWMIFLLIPIIGSMRISKRKENS
jgi:transcriptional regulator with XRE-family HTH domain